MGSVVSMASLDNDVAATSTPKRPGLVATPSIQDDARLMFQERDSSMTDDWATASGRDFAEQRTVIGKFNLGCQSQWGLITIFALLALTRCV